MDKYLDRWGKSLKTDKGINDTTDGKNSLFVLSVDGMMGKEALVVLTTLRRLISKKMDKPDK